MEIINGMKFYEKKDGVYATSLLGISRCNLVEMKRDLLEGSENV